MTKQGKKRWLVFCQPGKLNWLTKEAGECQNWCKGEGTTTLWGGRKGGQADLVATSCEMSSATDLGGVLAEMSGMGWKVARCAYHSQESWCSFSWGAVHETRAVISLLVLPRWCAVLGQRSSNLALSPSPVRALWSLPVPMCGGKCLVLDCFFPSSEDLGCELSAFAPG